MTQNRAIAPAGEVAIPSFSCSLLLLLIRFLLLIFILLIVQPNGDDRGNDPACSSQPSRGQK
jgi:hypothetical protein